MTGDAAGSDVQEGDSQMPGWSVSPSLSSLLGARDAEKGKRRTRDWGRGRARREGERLKGRQSERERERERKKKKKQHQNKERTNSWADAATSEM